MGVHSTCPTHPHPVAAGLPPANMSNMCRLCFYDDPDRPGQIVVSLGTSATLFGIAGQPVIDPTCAVCPFCDATGAWLPLICTLNCTVPAEEVRAFYHGHWNTTGCCTMCWKVDTV
jgi:hypothetical protein